MTTNHEHLREVADELNAMPFVIPNCKHMASVIYTSLDELAALRKENEELRVDAEKLPMALDAVELAEGVMSYCQGDAWERECMEKDRNDFDDIYKKLFPEPVVVESRQQNLYTYNQKTKCDICGFSFKGTQGVEMHKKAKHPDDARAAIGDSHE